MVCYALSHLHDDNNPFAVPIFILGVAAISRFSDGYVCGIAASVIGVVCVNYMFTYPFWAFDMTLSGYPLTFTVMLLVSVIISTLTTQVKHQQRLMYEVKSESMRANLLRAVSHDIRTPLSMVMGYAGQLEADSALPPARRDQAAIIRRQSQTIRDLVNDLNLTMRLDCQMQALRKTKLDLAPFLRQTAADFLNSGLAEGFSLALDLPDQPLPSLEADEFLLRRALNNLLINCVRHNPPGAVIRLGARQTGKACLLWVENTTPNAPAPPLYQEEDGGPAHGTGLKLVAQIAAAHGGQATFFQGETFLCQLRLPMRPS